MKAEHERQLLLLDLAGLDTRLGQIRHRRANLPQQQALDELARRRSEADADLVKARTEQSDIARDVTKAEADVQLVRDRAARNQARLDAGTGTPKEPPSLQPELASLARRPGELEGDPLETMERAEAVDALVTHLQGRCAELADAVAEATTQRDEAVALSLIHI